MAGGTAWARRMASDMPKCRDLARCDEFGDDAGDVLSRHVRVHPVLLVKVNYVRADAAQRPVGRLRDVLGPLTRPAWRPWPSNRWLVHVLGGSRAGAEG
jgi:hypothetical protein